MNKYDRLLSIAAVDCHIRRGNQESVEDFKARIIYSVISRQAYAALFDAQTVSIDHFKDRIAELTKIYAALYHDEINLSNDLPSVLYDLYLNAGYFYHAPYSITPSVFRAAQCDGILFLRGVGLNQKFYVSGAGFYAPSTVDQSFDTVNEMFAIPNRTLLETWQNLIRRSNWKVERTPDGMEFLRVSPPFTNGYWKNQPDRDGSISIARLGSVGVKEYFLYRFDGENFLFAQQPSWQSHRLLSNACLTARGTLPSINYKVDGAIVQMKIGYLPPPNELNLLKLYSWSQNPIDPSNNFKRIFDANIFFALKGILERRGYSFKEE